MQNSNIPPWQRPPQRQSQGQTQPQRTQSQRPVQLTTEQPMRQELTPWAVLQAINGSIGSYEVIAKKLGRPRLEVRKYIAANPDLLEAVQDEMMAATERVMTQQYMDAMEGNPQARESYIKMVSGYFSKKEEAKTTSSNGPRINIKIDMPTKTFRALDANNEVIDVGSDLKPLDEEEKKQ